MIDMIRYCRHLSKESRSTSPPRRLLHYVKQQVDEWLRAVTVGGVAREEVEGRKRPGDTVHRRSSLLLLLLLLYNSSN